MRTEKAVTWVVFQMTVNKGLETVNAVCEQSEWDQMERFKPGHHTLIQAGITNEAEAELLARGTSGDARRSTAKKSS